MRTSSTPDHASAQQWMVIVSLRPQAPEGGPVLGGVRGGLGGGVVRVGRPTHRLSGGSSSVVGGPSNTVTGGVAAPRVAASVNTFTR